MPYRESQASDLAAILDLHRSAFGREDEATLVAHLLADPSAQPSVSIVADTGGAMVGYALFTAVDIAGAPNAPHCAILAPLAVRSSHQRSGIGRGLIEHGCRPVAVRRGALAGVAAATGEGSEFREDIRAEPPPKQFRRYRFRAACVPRASRGLS